MVARIDSNTLPVDRGWAWVIAAAGFTAHSLMGLGTLTMSLQFVEIIDMFNASITTGSLAFTGIDIASSFSSVLVTHFVMPKLTERGCLVLGGILSFILSLAVSFAPNIGALIGIMAVKGMAGTLIFIPSIALVPQYFKRYRSRASVFPFCGFSAASIIGPFFIRAVRKEYGIRGTFMLLSACELNFCLAGLLLRPTSSYRFRPVDAKTAGKDASAVGSLVQVKSDTDSHDGLGDAAAKEANTKLLQVTRGGPTEDAEATETLLDQHDIGGTSQEQAVRHVDELGDGIHAAVNSERTNTVSGAVTRLGKETGVASVYKKENVTVQPTDNRLSRWQKFYYATSLELWAFRWMLISVIPLSVFSYVLNFLPTIYKFQGASLDQVAYLATIHGCLGLAGRIVSGFIADTHVLLNSQLFVIALVCLGVGCHLLRFATTFETLIPIVIFIGAFYGTRGPMHSLVCLEVVGPQKMPQSFSMSSLVVTLFGSILNPALGSVVEKTGSFVPVLHILGSIYFLAAGLLVILPLFTRLDAKHGRKK